MRLTPLNIRLLLPLALLLLVSTIGYAQTVDPDTTASDSLELIYPFEDVLDPTPGANTSLLQLEDPSNVETQIEYDPETGDYNIGQNMGELNYRPPTYMTFDEYQEYNADQAIRDYWREKAATESDFQRKPLIPKINIKSKLFESIFRGTTIDIKPQGSAELIFGVNVSKVANPALPANQQTTTAFDFDQNIQLNVTGKIGEAMSLGVNYNTEATFDFENQTKLEYTGDEDQIIQKIEAGNVALPLTGSLIQGSQNLFGVKAALKFGRLTVTGIFSQQRGQSNSVETEGGAQVTEFQVKADEYEDNKHYFLSQFFRDEYDGALSQLPVVRSSINITKIEVYVTRVDMAVEDNRNVVAFMDLGEGIGNVYNTALWGTGNQGPPQNGSNSLYADVLANYSGVRDVDQVHSVLSPLAPAFTTGQDYEMLRLAKRLEPNDYRLNSQLGYISLNQELQADQVLAVAFQYTYNGQVYQVGEFSTDGITGEQALVLKMLKATITNPRLPMWDLMMKNVYNIGAYQLSREDFRLDVIYDNVEAGTKTNYITEGAINGEILLRVCDLDQLNNNNDPFPDGYFDFVEGTTISSNNGRIYFPIVEPFGEHLASKFAPGEAEIRDKYVFQQLYDSTKQSAKQFPELNRFLVAGRYKGEGGGSISLGALNIPQGSVTVTAGSTTLQEGTDYTVDYTLGRVTIINDAYKDQPITATSESNSLFNIQQKTLAGVHLDYEVSRDITLGATMLNLTQRPLTQKVNAGDEPISNTIWGVNGTYRTESRLLTKIIDKIPLINTKEVSSIAVTGEFAHLIPGNARAISKAGIAYIDDFEGSVNFIDLKTQQTWMLASTPRGQTDLFPEGGLVNNVGNGYNRAKLAWYVIDPIFYRNNNLTPDHLTADDQSDHNVREVIEQEIFPNRQPNTGNALTNIPMFDLAFYPDEKGPYNYDADGVTPNGESVGYGLEPDGSLSRPEKRWGGIMREINTPDFQENNIEFIQIWMMDPFHADVNNSHSGGDLYFNLGSISEDIISDGAMSFEHGLPTPDNPLDTNHTNLAVTPTTTPLNNAFDNDPATRAFQDIGLDGMNDANEREFFDEAYIDKLDALLGSGSISQVAYDRLVGDPSTDNFLYYRGDSLDTEEASVLERYKSFNGYENNSPTADQTGSSFQASSTTLPNIEDLNGDQNTNFTEQYFQYRVSLRPEDMVVGKNYITDVVNAAPQLQNGQSGPIKWYQLKIPVRDPDKVVGGIQDFLSIRFMRMFFKGFEDSVVVRFARLELVRGEWRRYEFSLAEPGEYIPDPDGGETSFDISVVNIEENGEKDPTDYILPPGIDRQQTPSGTTTLRQLNEQSLLLKTCGLADGDARSAFKNTQFDFRAYKRLKMFVHAEAIGDEILNDDDVAVFVRMGTDFNSNYYEYEIPLKVTQPGATDEYDVWPLLNNLDVEFQALKTAKQQRNRDMLVDQSVSITKRYEVEHGPANKIYVKGNPNLANVKSLMIGIRNPKKKGPLDGDDGMSKCAEIWVNEFRLTDFDNKGGWATTGQLTAKLADLATVNVAANYTKFGFGNFDSRPQERIRENLLNYDISGTIQLGKFIPKKVGINAPMYLSFSESFATPEFNPLDPDITMAASLADLEDAPNSAQLQTDLKRQTESYTKRRGMNFTDIRKTKTGGGKSMPWDVSNLSFNYAYNQVYQRNVDTEYNETRTYQGGAAYDYNATTKPVKPFAKLKLVNKIVEAVQEHRNNKFKDQKEVVDSLRRERAPRAEIKEEEEELEKRKQKKDNYKKWSRKMLRNGWWRPIKDFNFNYAPSRLGFRTDMDRRYTETQLRNTTTYADIKIDPTYQKSFLWNREYHLKYDLTKAIRIQYDAFNFARVDEPEGVVDKNANNWEFMKDSIWRSIRDFGRTTQYNQTTAVNWTLPINKFPWFSWITANASYTGNYTWNAAPLFTRPDGSVTADSVGNTIQNSQNMQLNATGNLTNLYNKIPFLKKINQKRRRSKSRNRNQKQAKEKPEGGEAVADSTKKKKRELKGLTFIGEGLAGILMSLRTANFTYSETNGTLLPGYLHKTEFVGLSTSMDNQIGMVPFLFGWQNANIGDWDIREEANQGNWITQSGSQQLPMSRTHSTNLNMRATLEPIKGLRIDVTATRTYSESISEFFRWNDTLGFAEVTNQVKTGNFSTSFIAIQTAFEKPGANDQSDAFDEFLANRAIYSGRLASEYPDLLAVNSEGYSEGYGEYQQDIVIPAFLAAYSGSDANTYTTNPMPRIPMPNWRATYDGLGKLPFMKKLFKNITVTHAYRSTYNVNSFTSNLAFEARKPGTDIPLATDPSGNFIPFLQINNITLAEQFAPLIGIDMNWKNSITTRFEYKKSRNLSLSFANNQLTELKTEEFVIGAGYTFKNVVFPIKFGKSSKRIVSDLKMQIDVAIRDNLTLIRKIEEELTQRTSGQKLTSIKVNFDYVISPSINVRLFYDATFNNPAISSSYPTENHAAGLSLRFTLTQ